MNDVAHEEDYESEDMDVQPKSVKLQHYKKLGTIWIWAVVGFTFFLSVFVEYLYNHYPDVEFFRKPLPPPMDYPDPFTTPDTMQLTQSSQLNWKYKRDAGVYKDIQFEVIDGKKRYKRFAGVNQPMDFV